MLARVRVGGGAEFSPESVRETSSVSCAPQIYGRGEGVFNRHKNVRAACVCVILYVKTLVSDAITTVLTGRS